MALAQRAFVKKWKSSSPSKPKATSRARTCYNYGNQHHFIADCPYERVEDHNGRLVRKEIKAKSYPPINFDKKKAVPIHALTTQEEYLSGDDASDDEEVGKAAIAIVLPLCHPSSLPQMSPSVPITRGHVQWLTLQRYHLLSYPSYLEVYL
jgi:hypothetical protein